MPGQISLKANTGNIQGASVVGDHIDVDINQLSLASVHNSQSSQGSGSSLNAGLGSDGLPTSLGGSQNNSNGERAWVDEQTQIIARQSMRIKSKQLSNTGALIANARHQQRRHTHTDKGKLDWQVENYSAEDISNIDQQQSNGINANMSLSGSGSSSLGGSNSGHDKRGLTQAQPLATPNKTLKINGNRHLNASQQITRDWQTGGLDASVTVDHRLLSKAGRTSIKEDLLKTGMMVDAAQQVIQTEKVGALDFNQQLEIQNNTYEGVKEVIANDKELQAYLADPNITPEQKQAMYQKNRQCGHAKIGGTQTPKPSS